MTVCETSQTQRPSDFKCYFCHPVMSYVNCVGDTDSESLKSGLLQ